MPHCCGEMDLFCSTQHGLLMNQMMLMDLNCVWKCSTHIGLGCGMIADASTEEALSAKLRKVSNFNFLLSGGRHVHHDLCFQVLCHLNLCVEFMQWFQMLN